MCRIPAGLLCGIPTRIPVTKSVTNPTGLVPHRLCETVPQESYRTFSLGPWHILPHFPLTKCLPQVIDEVHLHVRTCAPLFHKCSACCFLGNSWADCVEIWYALGSPLATAYAVVTRFCISQTARPIVFKFGVWISSHYLSAFHKSWVGYLCTCARADRTSVSQERSLSTCFPQVRGWGISARAHVHPHLRISGSEWPIVLKFDVWLETQ